MRDNVERFVANGGNFVVLSGNTCFRQVRLEDNERTLVFYKYAGADPDPDDTEKVLYFPNHLSIVRRILFLVSVSIMEQQVGLLQVIYDPLS